MNQGEARKGTKSKDRQSVKHNAWNNILCALFVTAYASSTLGNVSCARASSTSKLALPKTLLAEIDITDRTDARLVASRDLLVIACKGLSPSDTLRVEVFGESVSVSYSGQPLTTRTQVNREVASKFAKAPPSSQTRPDRALESLRAAISKVTGPLNVLIVTDGGFESKRIIPVIRKEISKILGFPKVLQVRIAGVLDRHRATWEGFSKDPRFVVVGMEPWGGFNWEGSR